MQENADEYLQEGEVTYFDDSVDNYRKHIGVGWGLAERMRGKCYEEKSESARLRGATARKAVEG
jgi:hypothetical protein